MPRFTFLTFLIFYEMFSASMITSGRLRGLPESSKQASVRCSMRSYHHTPIYLLHVY